MEMKKILIFALLGLLCLSTLSVFMSVNAQEASSVDWWPTLHHDVIHTGVSTSAAPLTNGKLWTYATGNLIDYSSAAVINGVVYVGSDDNYLYALNAANGALIWQYKTGNAIDSSPTVANGVVFFGSEDNKVYALNATTGSKIWSYGTGGQVNLLQLLATA